MDPSETPFTPPPSLPRRFLAFLVSHGMGMFAYSIVSPVIVMYTMFVLAVVAFALLGGGAGQEGSLVQNAILALLALGDGAWVDTVWSPELSLERNALRLFGSLGLLLWLLELATSPFRRGAGGEVARSDWERFRAFAARMGLFTLALSTVLLFSVFVIQAREVGLTAVFVLRGTLTAYAMGLLLLLFSAPALALWFLVQVARRPVAAAIAGEVSGAGPSHPGAPPSPDARSAEGR